MNICLYFGVAPTVEDEGRLKNIFSSEVPDSDNNSITESVEFSDSSFRTIAQNLLWKSLSYFTLEAQFRTPNFTSGRSELKEREREISRLVFGVFQLRNWSAIYSAPGGANGFEPNERLHPFDPAIVFVGSLTVATVGSPTDAERSVGGRIGSGAERVRFG